MQIEHAGLATRSSFAAPEALVLTGEPTALRLTPDELSTLLSEAIARHSQSQQSRVASTSLEDALEIAQQLSIPREHVLAAAQDLVRQRMLRDHLAVEERTRLRRSLKDRRKAQFLNFAGVATGLDALLLTLCIASQSPEWLVGMGLLAVPFTALFTRWLLVPVTEEDVERALRRKQRRDAERR